MTSPRSVAALAAAAAGVLWLVIWWHQRLAHGDTAVNEKNVVLGLTWMDSGKALVLPLLLFLVSIVGLYRATREPGRLGRIGFLGSAGALAALIVGVALQFWGFDWGSYDQEFEEASIGAGGALQAVAALLLAVALIPVAIVLARRRVLPGWIVPLLPLSAVAMFWLTPANVFPGLAWLVFGAALLPVKPLLRSSAVSASEKDRDADDCPNCGTRVESDISAPGEQLRESTRRRCPNCGKILRRVVGGSWTVDETER